MKNNRWPLISIGIPVYNEEKYIENLLSSIVDQDYPNLEIIISDNFSQDNTWLIIQNFLRNDLRITAVRQPINKGAVYNFYYVLNKSQGDFFIWAGGHDVWGSKNMLTSCILKMLKNPNIVLSVPETRWIDEKGDDPKVFPKEFIDTTEGNSPAKRVLLLMNQMVRCSSIHGLHRRTVLKNTLPWPSNNDVIGLYRIASQGNIVTNSDVFWCRRIIRVESLENKVKRFQEMNILENKSMFFLYIQNRYIVFSELINIGGPILDRIQLIIFFFKKYLNLFQIRLILISCVYNKKSNKF